MYRAHPLLAFLLAPAVLSCPGCSLLTSFPECAAAVDCPAGWSCESQACVEPQGPELVEVTEDIRVDTEWTADRTYVLRREIAVEPGKT